MKAIRLSLSVLALASLFCLFFSSSAFAQVPGSDDPCCHHAPGIMASTIQNEIQPLIHPSQLALDAQVNRAEMPMIEQSAFAIIGKAAEMTAVIEKPRAFNYRR